MADARRRFTTVLALLVLACNALTASVLHRFPDDALHLSRHVALYSYFSSFVSVLGLVGAIRSDATLVTIFANFFLVDVFISIAPRFLVLFFLPSIRDSICSLDAIAALLHSREPIIPTSEVDINSMREMRYDAELVAQGQCNYVVTVVMTAIAVAALVVSAIQILLAVRVSAYAAWLRRVEGTQSVVADEVQTEVIGAASVASKGPDAVHAERQPGSIAWAEKV